MCFEKSSFFNAEEFTCSNTFLFDNMYQLWYIINMEIEKKLQVEFFKTEQNNEPVRDFLKALSLEDKKDAENSKR